MSTLLFITFEPLKTKPFDSIITVTWLVLPNDIPNVAFNLALGRLEKH